MKEISLEYAAIEKVDTEKKGLVRDQLLKEKINVLRVNLREHLGFENYHKFARHLYDVIYHPEKKGEIISELGIKNTEKFPNRLSAMTEPISISAGHIPSAEEFEETITRVLSKGVDYKSCVYEGAEDQLENMARMGPVRIWTAGDALGLTNDKGEVFRGSQGQLKKIILAGNINEIRNKISVESKRDRKDVITILASENKFSRLSSIGEEFRDRGIKIVVIIEDNLIYLIRAEEEIKKFGLEVTPIWIRQGDQKNTVPKDTNKDLEHYIKAYNAQDSVRGISEFLKTHNISAESIPGFIVDYDEVIMDSNKKVTAQGEAVLTTLKNNGWI